MSSLRKEAAEKFASSDSEERRRKKLFRTAFGKGEKATVLPGLAAAAGLGWGAAKPGTQAMKGYAHLRAMKDVYQTAHRALPDAMKAVEEAQSAVRATKGIEAPTWRGKKPGRVRKFVRGIFRAPDVVTHVERASNVIDKSRPIRELQTKLKSVKKMVATQHAKIPGSIKSLNRIANIALPILGAAALVRTVSNATQNASQRAGALKELAQTSFRQSPGEGRRLPAIRLVPRPAKVS